MSAAFGALGRVVAGVGAGGDGLSRFDDAAIGVAVLAVRGVINTERFGTPRPSSVVTDSHLCALARTAGRVAADAEARRSRTGPGHAAGWLQDAILASDRVARCAAVRAGERDPVLRAEARAALRAAWVALGCAQVLLVAEIEALTSARTYANWPELCAKLAGLACRALSAAALVDRPHEFDHSGAARRQRAAVIRSVGPLGIALQTEQRRHLDRARGMMVERLARVVAAIWCLDACLPIAAGGGPDGEP